MVNVTDVVSMKVKEIRMELDELHIPLCGSEKRKYLEKLLKSARLRHQHMDTSKCFGLFYDHEAKGNMTNPYPCRVCFESDCCKFLMDHNKLLGVLVEVPDVVTPKEDDRDNIVMAIDIPLDDLFKRKSSLKQVAELLIKENGKITKQEVVDFTVAVCDNTPSTAATKYYQILKKFRNGGYDIIENGNGKLVIVVKG